ncbi:fructoselysine 6-kinase [Pseudomonas sp. NPDC087358]|uniref:fructoselysine 6-kinase n=1 Tax=Pseudomonas sp. NPDC087358 TaxID=3364439 RepID=UPI00384BF7DE
MKSLVTVGDNCIDVYPALGRGFSGGNAVNVAVHSARHGLRPAYVGWVGEDAYGQQLRRELAAEGVDTSHLHSKPGSTAQTFVHLHGNERVLGEYAEGVMSGFYLSEQDLSWIARFDVVHAGIWGHVEPYLGALKARGKIISFDFADKWDSPLWHELPPSLDYAFASAREDSAGLRGRLREVSDRGAGTVIATLGPGGSLAYDGQRFWHQCAIPVDIVDTMGAGDAFIAGFLSAIARDLSVEQAMEQGARGAALTLQCQGAWG